MTDPGRPVRTGRRHWLRWLTVPALVVVGAQCRTERKVVNCEVTSVVTTPAQVEVAVGETSQEIAAAVADNGACQPSPAVSWSITPAGIGQLTSTSGTRTSVVGSARGSASVTAAAGGRTSSPATVSVYERARIVLNLTRLDFAATRGAPNPPPQNVSVTGAGDRPLEQVQVTFRYAAGGPIDWLAVAVSGSAAPLTIQGRVTRTDLPAGAYSATIDVQSVVASNSPQTITVAFVVTEPAGFQLAITGTGDGSGTVTGPAADGNPAINCAITAGAATGQCAGSYSPTTQLNLVAQAAGGSTFSGWSGACGGAGGCAVGNTTGPVSVVAGFTTAQALIGLNPPNLTFNGTAGAANPPNQTVQVTNAGPGGALTGLAVGAIDYGSGPAGWIGAASLSANAAPATLTVQVAIGALGPGAYTAMVPISSPVAGNSPQNLTVTFNVAAPMILLGTNPVTGLALAGGTNQFLSRVSVTSSGLQITGLSLGAIQYGPGANGWIQSAALSSTSTSQNTFVDIQVSPAALAAGTYTATIPVSGAGVATQNLMVSLQVLAAPGGTIVFGRGTSGTFDNTSEVWRMNANGSNQMNLTNNAAPDGRAALSPAGDQIAFRSDRTGNAEIWRMASNGSAPTQVTATAAVESFPAWVNSAFLAYSAADPLNQSIQNILFVQVAAAACPVGACPTGSVSNGATNAWPTASATSPLIAYGTNVNTGNNNFEIWTYNWSVGGTANLSNSLNFQEIHPAYSPNGQRIAFATNRGGGNLLQVWVMDANGANKTQLTFGPGNNYFPSWSPDGAQIVFVSDRTGNVDIWMMNANGSVQVNVTNSPGIEERPSWR